MNNSRIVNELIEKANEWSYEEYNYKETGYTREQLYSQKLAELIVLECIKMIENEAEQYAQPTWAVELVNDIKENFGIEKEWTQESKDWVIKNFGIEPCAWQAVGGTIWNHKTSEDDRPLYTKPFEWQGLTDEEIHDCFQNRGRGSDGLKTRKLIAAAIEAMLREKNT